jgi:hypothetical protein
LNGQTLTFAASGWTWHDIFILWDHETGSLWFPGLAFPGGTDFLRCIAGPLQDQKVRAVEYWRVTWRSWFRTYPETEIMFVIPPR